MAELPLAGKAEVVVPRIGPYRIERRLGVGGMGEVYLAEQYEPIRRQVALKVIRAGGQASDRILARFDVERQLLALMQHPGIAQLYDAGVTETGAPYFAMEYVDGVPLTLYCDHRRLDVEARLGLFADLCDAIQHAHQKGVIHRDLKPSNLLVTERDGRPVVKVIDFGVAKASRGHLAQELQLTQLDVAVGTLAFMSPEQLDRRIAPDLDTRSDVYALGLLLYELLAGVPPFAASEPALLMAEILSGEVPALWRRFLSSERAGKIARRRSAETATLARRLEGDLEWIVSRALEKNPEDRYASVSELAADLKRHRDHLPVLAGPPTWTYRARKFVRRNRLAVATASLGLLLLVVAAVGSSLALVSSRRSQAVAQREAAKARAASEFLREMLGAAAPGASGRDVRVLEVLDQASSALERQFGGEPEVEASLRSTLGRTYLALGLAEKALAEVDRALALAEPLPEVTPAQRLELKVERGHALAGLGRFSEAEAEVSAALGASDLPANDSVRLSAELALASLSDDLSRLDEAEARARAAALGFRRLMGADHRQTLEAESLLAMVLSRNGKLEESVRLHRDLLERWRRLFGPTHPATLTQTNNLAWSLNDLGEPEEALALLSGVIEEQRRVQGPDHPETLTSRHNLAAGLARSGRFEEAERELVTLLADRRRVLGPDHANTLYTLRGLATVLDRLGRTAEALPLAEEAHRRALATLGPDHEATARAETLVAKIRQSANAPEPGSP